MASVLERYEKAKLRLVDALAGKGVYKSEVAVLADGSRRCYVYFARTDGATMSKEDIANITEAAREGIYKYLGVAEARAELKAAAVAATELADEIAAAAEATD